MEQSNENDAIVFEKEPGSTVYPGDMIVRSRSNPNKTISIGNNVIITPQGIRSSLLGKVSFDGNTLSVSYLPQHQRFTPYPGAPVIGIVQGRVTESALLLGTASTLYQIDINLPYPAQLDSLAFDGATKKHRPRLTTGDVVFARILSLRTRGVGPLLTCRVSEKSGLMPKSWTTGESFFGPLTGGVVVSIPVDAADTLIRHSVGAHPLVQAATEHIPCSIVVGANGRMWVGRRTAQSPQPQGGPRGGEGTTTPLDSAGGPEAEAEFDTAVGAAAVARYIVNGLRLTPDLVPAYCESAKAILARILGVEAPKV